MFQKNLTRFTEKHLRRRNSGTDLFLWILRNFYEFLLCRTSADGCFCCLSQLCLFLLIQMLVLIWELSPYEVCFPPQMKQQLQLFYKWTIVTICTICTFHLKTCWCFRNVIVALSLHNTNFAAIKMDDAKFGMILFLFLKLWI